MSHAKKIWKAIVGLVCATSLSAYGLTATCTGSGPYTCTADLGSFAAKCSPGGTLITGLSKSNGATYYACAESFTAAVADAKAAFNAHSTSNVTYNLTIAGGTYDMSGETVTTTAYITLNTVPNAQASVTDALNITGATTGTRTVLVTNNSVEPIYARNVSHLHFGYIDFQRNVATTTMGVVTSVATAGQISFTVPTGFMDPQTLYDNAISDGGGNFTNYQAIRAYTDATSPQLVNVADNHQIFWGQGTTTGHPSCATEEVNGSYYCHPTYSGGVWTIYFDDGSASTYAPSDAYTGAMVCLKMEGPAQAYMFDDTGLYSMSPSQPPGTDVGFDHVTWQDMARGAFRYITSPFVTNSSIVARAAISGQNYCLSVPTGGPQFNQPQDNLTYNVNATVDHFTATNTGDDTIAIFNDNNNSSTTIGAYSKVTNSTISGSFARDVNLNYSCYVGVPVPYDPGPPTNANTISNCWSTAPNSQGEAYPSYYSGCVTDTAQVCSTTGTPPI